jgi:hypothetical protein
MARGRRTTTIQTLRFSKRIGAPLDFVYRWCTDYRDDDNRITESIYHYRAKVVLRERDRVVRLIKVPGKDPNRCTDLEIIRLRPPNRWSLTKLSWTDDEVGTYRLTEREPRSTLLEMRFRRTWKAGRPPNPDHYRALFNRVWDRYVEVIETEYVRRLNRRAPAGTV